MVVSGQPQTNIQSQSCQSTSNTTVTNVMGSVYNSSFQESWFAALSNELFTFLKSISSDSS